MSNHKPSQLRKLHSGSISKDDLLIAIDVDELTSPTGETKTIDFGNLSKAVVSEFSDATDIQYVSGSSSGSIYDVIEQKLDVVDVDALNDKFTNLNTDDVKNISKVPTVSNLLTEALDVLYLQSRSIAVGISTTQCFTSSAGQSVYNLPTEVVPQNSLVYREGLLVSNDTYTLLTDELTFVTPSSLNDAVCVIDFGQTASFGKNFLALEDTPGTYVDYENQSVTVNSTGDALVFKPTNDSFTSLNDTPSEYTSSANDVLTVNSSGDALVFKSSGSFLEGLLLNEADMASSSSVLGVTQLSLISYVSSSISNRIVDDSSFTIPSQINAPSQVSVVNYVASSINALVIDQDDMISNSPSRVPTQQSVKAYVDNKLGSSTSTPGNSVAIIQEQQENGKYCDGNVGVTSGQTWRDRYTKLTGTPQYYSRVLDHNMYFFKRNLNTLRLNRDNIVEDFDTSKSTFTLSPGFYTIRGWVYGYDTLDNCVRLKRHDNNSTDGSAYLSSPPLEVGDSKHSPGYFSFFLEVLSVSADRRTFSIEHGVMEFNQSRDLGQPYTPAPQPEVYCQVEITKV